MSAYADLGYLSAVADAARDARIALVQAFTDTLGEKSAQAVVDRYISETSAIMREENPDAFETPRAVAVLADHVFYNYLVDEPEAYEGRTQ